MIQFNLCNNDVIIILIIFFVFCIFLYMNKNNEHFTLSSNDVKKQYIQTIKTFFNHFTIHIGDLKNLIDDEKKLINSINNKDTPSIIDNINLIKDKYKKIVETLNTKLILDENIEISKYLNKLMSYINNLLLEHNKLFIDNEIDDDIIFCNETITTNKFFYNNLPNKLDVIENNNISQLKLIKYNIDEIKDIINKLNFNDFKFKLLNILSEYYEVLELMFNKNSVNIFNKINETNKSCENDQSVTTGVTTGTSTIEGFTNPETEPSREYNNDNKLLIIISEKLDKLSNISNEIVFESRHFSIDEIFKREDSSEDHFRKTKANLKLEQQFCKKLKELNKPNKKNIVFKRFRNDLIEQKKKYIKKLEENIYTIQKNMSEKELYDYDINKLRTHDQASKQYNAIMKGIDNIKNRNKVKINLT